MKALCAALVLCAVASSAQAQQQTPTGYDTNGTDMLFSVQGNEVGDWNTSQLGIIGNLTTTGGVKEGYVSATCNAGEEAMQRYNPSSHSYEYCNGTSWEPMGSPSGTLCGGGTYLVNYGFIPYDNCNGVQFPNCPEGYYLAQVGGNLAGSIGTGWQGAEVLSCIKE